MEKLQQESGATPVTVNAVDHALLITGTAAAVHGAQIAALHLAADLERLLPASVLSEAYEVAFRAYVQQHAETWGRCLSADCEQVFRKRDALFQCDCCLADWCTNCLLPYHHGQSCGEHQAWLKASRLGDSEFEEFSSSSIDSS
eukprot:gene16644-22894_t